VFPFNSTLKQHPLPEIENKIVQIATKKVFGVSYHLKNEEDSSYLLFYVRIIRWYIEIKKLALGCQGRSRSRIVMDLIC